MPITIEKELPEFWTIIRRHAVNPRFSAIPSRFEAHIRKLGENSESKPSVFLLAQLKSLHIHAAQDEKEYIAEILNDLKNNSKALTTIIQNETTDGLLDIMQKSRAVEVNIPSVVPVFRKKKGSVQAELQSAIAKKNKEGVLQALAKKADVNMILPCGMSPLYLATITNSIDIVRILLERAELRVDQPHQEGPMTPLLTAADKGFADIVKALVQRKPVGANPNLLRPDGLTPLMSAITTKQLEVVKALALPNTVNYAIENGWTPLMYAAAIGYFDAIPRLLLQCANPYIVLPNGVSAISLAKTKKYTAISNLFQYWENVHKIIPWSVISVTDEVLDYLTKNLESKTHNEVSPLIKAQMMFYLADHPYFHLRLIGEKPKTIFKLIEKYAEQNAEKMERCLSQLLTPDDYENLLKYIKPPADYLDIFCRKKIAEIKQSPLLASSKASKALIDNYIAVLQLTVSTKTAIVNAMKKDSDYLQKYFMVKKIFASTVEKLTEPNIQQMLEFDYYDNVINDKAYNIARAIKDFTDKGIAKMFVENRNVHVFGDEEDAKESLRLFQNYINAEIDELKVHYRRATSTSYCRIS